MWGQVDRNSGRFMSHSPGKYQRCVPRDFHTLAVYGEHQNIMPFLEAELSLCTKNIRVISRNVCLRWRLCLAGLT